MLVIAKKDAKENAKPKEVKSQSFTLNGQTAETTLDISNLVDGDGTFEIKAKDNAGTELKFKIDIILE